MSVDRTSAAGLDVARSGRTAEAGPAYGIAPPGFRLPAATRLGRVRLQVANLARSVDYYERVLGLRVAERGNGRATLAPRHDSNALVELHEREDARPVPRHGRLGLYHFAILLPDRAGLGRFLGHLAALGLNAGMSDHLVSEAIYLTDPDGLGIEVYADRPRSSWTHEGGQLAMTTEPLDVVSVLASGGSEPWSGAPAGTVLGHVHLHVGDIDQGAGFYHVGLGFDKTVWSYPGALFLSAGGYHHHLGTNTWAARAPRPTENDARLVDWEIILPAADVGRAVESLAQIGVTVETAGADRVARDPWGTAVRLVGST